MVRTTRGTTPAAANVDDLDNLDLDDMFAEGNDDLFLDDDLGIDINMDDITSNATSVDDRTPSLPSPQETKEPSSRRRKTKRKTKSPFTYDTLEEESAPEPPKKKKRTSKVSTKKGKKADDTGKTTKSKLKGRSSVTLPTAASRATSTSGSSVAAAGQFGRRATLPKSRSSKAGATKGRASSTAAAAAAAAAEVAAQDQQKLSPGAQEVERMSQILSTHAGLTQNTFCGLAPSDNLFYPFMPALPTDLTMKNRKVYSLIERIHSSLINLQGGVMPEGVEAARETDAIFRLIQEAYREPSASTSSAPMDRVISIGTAIGRLRHTVANFDPSRIAADLYALCSLLKRQHDFLKQNSDNMRRWSVKNLAPDAYAEVYLPPQQRKRKTAPSLMSVLGSFSTDRLKVRLLLPGFKEPKSTLLAMLPPLFTPPSDASSTATKAKAKKRKIESTSRLVTAALPPKEKVALSYADCKPTKRRKMISDLISRTARELELQYKHKKEEQKQLALRQEVELRKLIQDDQATVPVIHTLGMWRWLEKSSMFGSFTDKDVRDRLDVVRQWPQTQFSGKVIVNDGGGRLDAKAGSTSENALAVTASTASREPLVDRLTSLLVEEDDGSDDESLASSIRLGDLRFDSKEKKENNEVLLDLSGLHLDEKASLHLKAFGLLKSWKTVPFGTTDPQLIEVPTEVHSGHLRRNRNEDIERSDLEEMVATMNHELAQLNALNHRRASFLESLALSSEHSSHGLKHKREREAAAIARCQNLLKKTRDSKVKSGKTKTAKDDLALPW